MHAGTGDVQYWHPIWDQARVTHVSTAAGERGCRIGFERDTRVIQDRRHSGSSRGNNSWCMSCTSSPDLCAAVRQSMANFSCTYFCSFVDFSSWTLSSTAFFDIALYTFVDAWPMSSDSETHRKISEKLSRVLASLSCHESPVPDQSVPPGCHGRLNQWQHLPSSGCSHDNFPMPGYTHVLGLGQG